MERLSWSSRDGLAPEMPGGHLPALTPAPQPAPTRSAVIPLLTGCPLGPGGPGGPCTDTRRGTVLCTSQEPESLGEPLQAVGQALTCVHMCLQRFPHLGTGLLVPSTGRCPPPAASGLFCVLWRLHSPVLVMTLPAPHSLPPVTGPESLHKALSPAVHGPPTGLGCNHKGWQPLGHVRV